MKCIFWFKPLENSLTIYKLFKNDFDSSILLLRINPIKNKLGCKQRISYKVFFFFLFLNNSIAMRILLVFRISYDMWNSLPSLKYMLRKNINMVHKILLRRQKSRYHCSLYFLNLFLKSSS